MSQKRVVVIGGGYGGTKLIQLLHNKGFKITLIDINSFHYLQPEIHEFIAGKKSIESIAFNLENFTQKYGANFVKDEVLDVDFVNKSVITKTEKLQYDYLVIATGSKTIFPPKITGLKENTFDVKDLKGALYFRHKFEEFFFFKFSERKHFSIIIGGAGLSGVEIALELANRVRIAGFNKEKIRIILIEPLESVLFGLDKFLIDKTTERLNELEVERIHGQFITKVDKNFVTLGNESTIHFDIFMFTAGIIVNNFLKNIEVNPKNQLIVDEYLRIKGLEREFVVGDIAEIRDKKGNFLPPTAQVAKQNAKSVAQNIMRLEKNQKLKSAQDSLRGVMIALGGKEAVGVIGNFKVSGYLAYLLKKFVFYIHSKAL